MTCSGFTCTKEIPASFVRKCESTHNAGLSGFANGVMYHYWRGSFYCSKECERSNEELREKQDTFDASKALWLTNEAGQPTKYRLMRDKHLWAQSAKARKSGHIPS